MEPKKLIGPAIPSRFILVGLIAAFVLLTIWSGSALSLFAAATGFVVLYLTTGLPWADPGGFDRGLWLDGFYLVVGNRDRTHRVDRVGMTIVAAESKHGSSADSEARMARRRLLILPAGEAEPIPVHQVERMSASRFRRTIHRLETDLDLTIELREVDA